MNLNALYQVEKTVESNNHWNSSVSNFFANGWVDFHSEKRAFQHVTPETSRVVVWVEYSSFLLESVRNVWV